VPAVCVVMAALTTVAVGVVGGWRGRTRAAALCNGVWAGLVSGAVMVSGMVTILLSNLDLLGARADYRRELVASGMTDMATYLAADAVAASITHMIINLGLGLGGAAVGWIIISALQQHFARIAGSRRSAATMSYAGAVCGVRGAQRAGS